MWVWLVVDGHMVVLEHTHPTSEEVGCIIAQT